MATRAGTASSGSGASKGRSRGLVGKSLRMDWKAAVAMAMMQVPVTTSQLRNVLVRIVTHPRAAGELVATAADLIAADERYDDWFVRVAKSTLTQEGIEEALQMSDDMTDAVEAAWCRYEKTSGADCADLLVLLKSSVARLRSAMGTGVP